MKSGFYAIFVTGEAGESIALLHLENGQVLGFDGTGGKWKGSYRMAQNTVSFLIEVTLLGGTNLTTTGATVDHDQKIEVNFECVVSELTNKDHLVNLPIGEVITRFRYLGPSSETQMA